MPAILRTDYRFGGVPRYLIMDEEESLVNVPDQMRKCVAFLQCQTTNGPKMAGTVFFVSVDDGGLQHTYAVTAKHVIDSIRAKAIDGHAQFRLNILHGGIGIVPAPLHLWRLHPTDSVTDLMVQDVTDTVGEGPFEAEAIPLANMAATDEIIQRWGIGVGDEVFLAGLFYRHYGNKRNIPIIRCGNIAAMPEEPVDIGDGQSMDAYLVEMRSLGGLSGSPVFTLHCPDGKYHLGPTVHLLGLMHGHWSIEKDVLDEFPTDTPDAEPLNTGIGVVVPVMKILEAIHQDRLTGERQSRTMRVKAKNAPTPDLSP